MVSNRINTTNKLSSRSTHGSKNNDSKCIFKLHTPKTDYIQSILCNSHYVFLPLSLSKSIIIFSSLFTEAECNELNGLSSSC